MNSKSGRIHQISKSLVEAYIEQGMRSKGFLFDAPNLRISLEGPDLMTIRLVPDNEQEPKSEGMVLKRRNGKKL